MCESVQRYRGAAVQRVELVDDDGGLMMMRGEIGYGHRWTLDNILRVMSYCGLYGASALTESNGGKATETAAFLEEAFNKMTDARFTNRITGLPATLEGFFSMRAAEHASKAVDTSTLSVLNKVMVYSMLVYYPLEHAWFLSTLKPKLINIDSDKWSMWSCRAWTVYILCDLAGTVIRARALSDEIAATERTKASVVDKSKAVSDLKRRRMHLRVWLTCVLADLVMAGHWSVPNGPVSPKQICAVGIYGGVAGLWLKWIKSASQA